jgi:ketosteroid isomerase-like protein
MEAIQNQRPLIILNDFFQHVSDKNVEAVLSFFTDNVEWYIPKSDLLPWTGRLTTKVEIAKTFQLLFDAHVDGEDQLEIDKIFIDGNEAAVFGKASRVAKKTGKRFTTLFSQKFTIVDGKITNFLMLEDTPEIEKAF